MTQDELNNLLGGWEGYGLGTMGRVKPDEEDADYEEVWIELLPRSDRTKICSGCGEEVAQVHDFQERWVRDQRRQKEPTEHRQVVK